MYELLSYLGQVTPSTPPSSLFSVLIFRFPVSVPNWLMGWMTHSHWRAGGLNPSVCSCDGRISTQFWLQFWKSILDLSSLSHPHYSRNTLLTSRKMRWKALHTSRCPISLSHHFPYWNFSHHPTHLKKKKKKSDWKTKPLSLFLKQNKTKMCHVTSSLNISFLTLVSIVVGCNLPSPWQQLPLFKFTIWQAALNTPLSLFLCKDGNAITPTPKDWNPNEWKTKEAMLRIWQRGREPPKRLSVCPYGPLLS